MLTQDEALYIKGQGITYQTRIVQAMDRREQLIKELAEIEVEIARYTELRDIYNMKLLPEMEAYEAVHGKVSLGKAPKEEPVVEEPISG